LRPRKIGDVEAATAQARWWSSALIRMAASHGAASKASALSARVYSAARPLVLNHRDPDAAHRAHGLSECLGIFADASA